MEILKTPQSVSVTKVIIHYSAVLFIAYFLEWGLFYFFQYEIPVFIPGTPINIRGGFLLGSLILFLYLLIKRLMLIDPQISIWKLTLLGLGASLIVELPIQLVRQITLEADTIGERLYFFFLGIITTIFLGGAIAFLIAFKRKTKRTDLFTVFIILIFIVTYFIKRQFFSFLP